MSTDGYTRESVVQTVQSGGSLAGEKLKGIDLSATDLRGGKFKGAHFRYSDLRKADLRGADLRESNLRHVNLTETDLRDADLRGADLTHADIRGALLSGAKLKGAKFGSTKGLSAKVFFPQSQLDKLIAEKSADLNGEELVIAGRGERWRLESAARIIGVEAGEDVKKVVNKLLSEADLKKLGLEVYRDTALLAEGDTVYKLIPGMIGTPLHEVKLEAPSENDLMLDPANQATPIPAAKAKEPTPEERKKSDQELINEFLLKRLTS